MQQDRRLDYCIKFKLRGNKERQDKNMFETPYEKRFDPSFVHFYSTHFSVG